MSASRLLVVVAIALGVIGAVALGSAWLLGAAGIGHFGGFTTVAGLAWAAIIFVAWLVVWGGLLRPLRRMASEIATQAETKSGRGLDAGAFAALGPLVAAVNAMLARIAASQGETQQAVASATQRADEQKRRLEALLRDLSEGVVVCNLNHQVLLYNQMAAQVLGGAEDFGLGRSLFGFLTREPVLHAFDWLNRQAGGGGRGSTALVCATADSRSLLHGRMSLILGERDEAAGYVLTLADATSEMAALAKRDALLRAALDGTRAPLANLRAAAETLAAHPDMAAEQAQAFQRIVAGESARLSQHLAELGQEHRGLGGDYGAMADLYSVDLINCVVRRARESLPVQITLTGRPQWLRGDSYALMLTLTYLLGAVHRAVGGPLDLEARAGKDRIYLDIVWSGNPLPAALVSTWLEAPLAGVLGGLSVRQVLERHDSDLWSEADRPGLARLRVPLPRGREDAGQGGAATPERPEFYDFDLLQWPEAAPELARRSLRGLSFAAFDTETTGLHPAVDDIVSIAAVRIVNGRILTGETFNRLVNPGRPIPPESTRIHRITDAMVADRPPLAVVLPQFKAFAADAVLVGHNIAFDLSFLQAKEAATGVKLDNPILDIMLLSAMLHAETDDHGLDALAVRYGVEIVDRHSALGDAMITAAVLAAMLDTLERRGVKTLDEAVKASRVVVELKARQARFAAAGA